MFYFRTKFLTDIPIATPAKIEKDSTSLNEIRKWLYNTVKSTAINILGELFGGGQGAVSTCFYY